MKSFVTAYVVFINELIKKMYSRMTFSLVFPQEPRKNAFKMKTRIECNVGKCNQIG